MTFYRILWGIDLLVALIALAFFAIGIADGTVSSFNIALWLAILAGISAVVFGARSLARRENVVAACVVAAALALPAFLFALLMTVAIVSGVRWN
jgi:ABC-type microcin C transport system permease subunit YejB